MRRFNILAFYSLIFFMVLVARPINAQNISRFQYIDPVPNSLYVSINTGIIIRQGDPIDKASISNDLIEATGSKSGMHMGEIILANDKRTLIFKPIVPFQTDEEVTVTLKNGLMTTQNINVRTLVFKFHTCSNTDIAINEPEHIVSNNSKINTNTIPRKLQSVGIPDTALPSDLPLVIVDSTNNPSPGYFFLPSTPYLQIVDNEGTPIFYRNLGANNQIFDFDLQPNGELTYFTWQYNLYGLDSTLNLIHTYCTDADSGATADGFHVDIHEMRVLPNGDYYLFARKVVVMDLSQYGGFSNAKVLDGTLQEFDPSGNLLFNWVASEHYQITDLDRKDANTNLTNSVQDFPHFNSVDFDSDGNLLISARNMDEITKVDRNTGDIIWRWGGRNNQFKFVNDSIGFSRQHDIRRFSSGDFSLFDNGTYHINKISSAVEYQLNELDTTATLVYRIYHYNDSLHIKIFTDTEGSVQELPNGNKVIAWGHNYTPLVCEVTSSGATVANLNYQYYVDTYRAFKYQWQPKLFVTNTDSINFGKVVLGDSLVKQFTVYNPHQTAVTINQFYCNDSSFTTKVNLPVNIQPGDSLVVPVTFKPNKRGSFKVSFNVRDFGQYQGEPQMIARQVILSGTTEGISSVNSNGITPARYDLYQNYPNPFNPSTTISFEIPKSSFVILKVYDALGREIETLVNEEKPAGRYNISFNASRLSSGIYFYRIIAGNFSSVKKMLLIK